MKKFFAALVLVMFALCSVAFAEGSGGTHGEKAAEKTIDRSKITNAPSDPISGTVQAAAKAATIPAKAVTGAAGKSSCSTKSGR